MSPDGNIKYTLVAICRKRARAKVLEGYKIRAKYYSLEK